MVGKDPTLCLSAELHHDSFYDELPASIRTDVAMEITEHVFDGSCFLSVLVCPLTYALQSPTNLLATFFCAKADIQLYVACCHQSKSRNAVSKSSLCFVSQVGVPSVCPAACEAHMHKLID